MKYFFSLLFLFINFSVLSAQEKHFIFIQSDNSQPFYVSLNSKLYSSTAIGYLIIPKLSDGDYNFSVGFPKNAFPEQTFQATINKKDLGFTLKNFADKGWGLFNLQSLAVTMSTGAESNKVAQALDANTSKKDDNEPITFTRKKKETPPAKPAETPADTALAVADSPAKKEHKEQEVKAEQKEQPEKKAAQEKESVAKVEQKEQPETLADSSVKAVAATSEENEKDTKKDRKERKVNKLSETKESDGVYLSYLENSKNADTVKVIILSDPISAVEKTPANYDNIASKPDDIEKMQTLPASEKQGASTTRKQKVKKEEKKDKDNLTFLDISTSAKDSTKADKSAAETKAVTIKNDNCKNIATDDDYNRLRKKMAHETTDEKMINEAKKAYRNRCFTTSQIKGLSTLFLSDEGRYRFFDASYNSVADASQYSSLQSEFIDKYYVNRFKAMIQ